MKRFFGMMSLVAVMMLTLASCGSKKHEGYVGKFTDQFGNKFELRADYTAGIEFVGTQKVTEVTWSDGEAHDRAYATISFNGNPNYYYLRDGVLYGSESAMVNGHPAIQIEWED